MRALRIVSILVCRRCLEGSCYIYIAMQFICSEDSLRSYRIFFKAFLRFGPVITFAK
jgi:hypothetical protein